MTTSDLTPDELQARLHKLGLHGLLAQWDEIVDQPWLRQLIAIEEAERQRRSLARRLDGARLGVFKPIADFDWSWPRKIERQAVEELFGLGYIAEGINVILVGPNGVGKTMILKNLAYHAILHGHTVLLTCASDMLADLAAQDSSAALARRLRRYVQPPDPRHRRGRLSLLQQPLRRSPLRSRHPPLRRQQAHPAQHQQGFQRLGRGFPSRHLHRHPRRSPRPSLRDPRDRRRQLPPQGSQGTPAPALLLTPQQEAKTLTSLLARSFSGLGPRPRPPTISGAASSAQRSLELAAPSATSPPSATSHQP
jgi:hypothetical protein